MKSLVSGRFASTTIALVALNVSLTAVIVSTVWRGTEVPALLDRESLDAADPRNDWLTPDGRLDAAPLLERPLFSTSRRLPDIAAATVSDARPPPAYRLVGTMLLPGRPAVGLLAQEAGQSVRVQLGDDVDGWVVEAIEARKVVLELAGERVELAAESSPANGRGRLTSGLADNAASAGVSPPPAVSSQPRVYRAPPQ